MARQRGKENAVSVFDLQRMMGDGMYEICGCGGGRGCSGGLSLACPNCSAEIWQAALAYSS